MSGLHSSSARHRFNTTIRVLCPLIEDRIKRQRVHHWREYDLRKELVGCILSSQVHHAMAIACTENLDRAGLLDDTWWSTCRDDGFGSMVLDVLSGQRQDLPHRGCHRFYMVRASQLVQVRESLARFPLLIRLANTEVPKRLRQSLIADIPGLGPKQASMFLRNVGTSYDLAILDTHVLRFMYMQALLPMVQPPYLGTITGYERAERVVIQYADKLGYPAGYLDWAIWATMKAARELGL